MPPLPTPLPPKQCEPSPCYYYPIQQRPAYLFPVFRSCLGLLPHIPLQHFALLLCYIAHFHTPTCPCAPTHFLPSHLPPSPYHLLPPPPSLYLLPSSPPPSALHPLPSACTLILGQSLMVFCSWMRGDLSPAPAPPHAPTSFLALLLHPSCPCSLPFPPLPCLFPAPVVLCRVTVILIGVGWWWWCVCWLVDGVAVLSVTLPFTTRDTYSVGRCVLRWCWWCWPATCHYYLWCLTRACSSVMSVWFAPTPTFATAPALRARALPPHRLRHHATRLPRHLPPRHMPCAPSAPTAAALPAPPPFALPYPCRRPRFTLTAYLPLPTASALPYRHAPRLPRAATTTQRPHYASPCPRHSVDDLWLDRRR